MPEISESRYTVSITWDDAPHLTEGAKEEMRRATPPHLIGARESGIPSLGSGAIYQIDPREFRVPPFEIPAYWRRVYSMDVGWKTTAVLWLAWDLDTDTLYAYGEHYRGHANPSTHARAVLAKGSWIPGIIDPAARQRSQRDGERIMDEYISLGLNLVPAKNTVESGIYRTLELLSQGRLKVFANLNNFFDEFRRYHRDENGKIIKDFDHLMDCLRYGVMGYQEHAIARPVEKDGPPRYAPGIPSVGY